MLIIVNKFGGLKYIAYLCNQKSRRGVEIEIHSILKSMTQKEEKLVLQDLCARLAHGVMCNLGLEFPLQLQRIFVDKVDGILLDFYADGNEYQVYLSEVKPYLRPLSSMTEKEKEEYCNLKCKFLCSGQYPITDAYEFFEWLNAHHFDYRGLIPRGLALEAPEGMYNFK